MSNPIIISAIQSGTRLELRYHGYNRIVEVHAYGVSTAGNVVIRAWQVRGGSVSNEPVGWKLFRLDEATSVHATTEASQTPRAGYKRGDAGMTTIYAQV